MSAVTWLPDECGGELGMGHQENMGAVMVPREYGDHHGNMAAVMVTKERQEQIKT